MKKAIKIISVVLLAVVIILAAGFLAAWYFITPERLARTAESILSESLGKKVIIKDIHIKLFDNPYVTVSGLELGSMDEIYMSSDEITVRFSKWGLLFGKKGIKSVDINEPYIVVHIDKIKKEEKTPEIPLIRTNKASCMLYYKDKLVVVENIRGSVSSSLANLSATALGGEIQIIAMKAAGSWKGKASLNNLNLAGLDNRFAGFSDGTASFTARSDDINGSATLAFRQLGLPGGINMATLSLKADVDKKGDNYSCNSRIGLTGLVLPWGGKVDNLDMKSSVDTDLKNITVKYLQVASNLVNFSGTASIKGLDKKKDMIIGINIKSDEFAYEPFVEFLPVKEFPDWLFALLKKQARKGRVRIEHATYGGRVKDFDSFEGCIKNMGVGLAVNGLTFSSRPGNIVKNIKAELVAKNGDLNVLGITGTVGSSALKSVTLRFPALHEKGFRIGIDGDLDMAAADFIQAWRAGVVAMDVNTFLDPVNSVKAGRVVAKASVFYEEETGGARVKGGAVISGLDMNWDKEVIRDLFGTVNSQEYFKPLVAEARCIFDDKPVDMLNMNITDPFGKIYFTYGIKWRGIPGSEVFSLDKDTSIAASGNGKWPDLSGNVTIRAKDFTLYGTQIKPKSGGISGTGRFSARIGQNGFINIPELNTILGNTNLMTKIYVSDAYSQIGLAGKVDLDTFNIMKKGDFVPYSGLASGSFSIRFGKVTVFGGSVDIDNIELEHRGMKTRIDGGIDMNGKNLSLKDIRLANADLDAKLNGTLIVNDIPEFKGDVVINSLNLDQGQGQGKPSADKAFDKIKVNANVTFANLNFSGMKIVQGTSGLQIDKGDIKLLGMDVKLPYGTVTGSVMVSAGGDKTYDLNINIDNTPVADILKMYSKDKPWLTGTMSVHGRVWGARNALNGDIKFKALNGVIDKYNLISKIFSILNPYKIIKTGEFDLKHDGFPYNHLSASLTIRDSYVSFDDFYLDSNSLQVSAVGKYMIRTKYIDVIMGIQPLETFDKTVSMIPIVGWVLTGDKGTLIVISLKVRGPVDDPSVKYLPAVSVSHPVAESLLRVLQLPVDLLTKPGDVILPNMNNGNKKNE